MEIAGKKVNKWVLIAGGGGAVLLFYLYKKSSAEAAADSSATDSSSIDPVTGLPYSQDNEIDPATGMTYLSEAEQYGSVSAAESAATSQSAYTSSGAYYGAASGGTAGYPTLNVTGADGATGNGYASNAAWSQAVTAGLAALGYEPTDISAALGLFFSSNPLGTAPDGVSYAQIIQAGVAEYGPPPVGNWAIIPEPSGGGAVGTGTGTTTGNTPAKPKTVSGLRATSATATSIGLAWTADPGASSYQVRVTYQSSVVQTHTTTGTTYTVSGLTANHTYGLHVVAINGSYWAPEASITKATSK